MLAGDVRLSVPDRCRAAVEPYTGRAITLGMRPEHVRLVSETGAQYPVLSTQYSVAFPATIEAVERLGAESHVYLKAGNHSLIVRTEGDIRPAAGERLFAALPPEHLYFFDPASEAAICAIRVPVETSIET